MSTRPRTQRPRLTQFIPQESRAPFQVVTYTPGETYYEITLREAAYVLTNGYEPIFRYTPPQKGCPFTVQQLAEAGAAEMTEGRGLICVQEIRDGIPIFTAIFVGDSRHVYCIRSSHPARLTPVHLGAQSLTRVATPEPPPALRPRQDEGVTP